MSSKEREWLEQRASYSLETKGGMEGWEPRWGEEGKRGDGNGGEDTSLTVSQRGRLPGKRGCASRTPLDVSARLRAHSHKLVAVGGVLRKSCTKQAFSGYSAATSPIAISMQSVSRERPARQHTSDL